MATRRPAGGRWQPPVVLTHFGSDIRIHELALTPGGDGLVAYGPEGDGGRIRAALLPKGGSPRIATIGRGILEAVTIGSRDRAHVVWSRFGRHDRLESAVVSLATGRVTKPHTVVDGCFGEIDEDRSDRIAGDERGRAVAVVACGKHQRASVARLPAP